MTQLAISLIKNRLQDTYGRRMKFVSGSPPERARPRAQQRDNEARLSDHPGARDDSNIAAVGDGRTPSVSLVRIIGEPTTPNEAATLAEEDKFQFQWWALGRVGARPVEQKKGADHGVDVKILFRDDPHAATPEQIVIQVNGGKTGVMDVRDLRGVLDRKKAGIGILISLQPPTARLNTLTRPSATLSPSDGARDPAASAGFYEHKTNQQKFPRLQLRTVKELMEGKGIERPTSAAAIEETFKKAPASRKKHGHQTELTI